MPIQNIILVWIQIGLFLINIFKIFRKKYLKPYFEKGMLRNFSSGHIFLILENNYLLLLISNNSYYVSQLLLITSNSNGPSLFKR